MDAPDDILKMLVERMIELPLSRQDLAEASGTPILTVSRLLAGYE